MDITPSGLSKAAACFQGIPPGDQNAIIILLLAQLAGNTMTPAQLAAAAKCFCFADAKVTAAVQVYLMASAATAAGA